MNNKSLIKRVIKVKIAILNSIIDLLPKNIGENKKGYQQEILEAIYECLSDFQSDKLRQKDSKTIKSVSIN